MANAVLKYCAVLLGVLGQYVAAHISSIDSDSFLEFMTVYGKTYSSADEFDRRFSTWQQNIKLINAHNEEFSIGLHSYTMGVNQFADMTKEEYREMMLTYKPQGRPDSNSITHSTTFTQPLPKSVDWKAQGYVTEVGNQGQCGSCWAFTATGALEGQHKKKTGILVDLSEQNLMDCSGKQGNNGCEGGLMDYAFKYVKENGGIDTEQSYPYNQTNPGTFKCKYRQVDSGATCTGYMDLPKGNETALQQAVAFVGPIAVAVDASHTGFMYYKSGVYEEPNCSRAQINHSLVVVGYGVENGKEYYNCKNSWGTTWGDQGYIKMVRNMNNQCGIASEASYPTV